MLIQKLIWRLKSQHIHVLQLLAIKNTQEKLKPSTSYYLNKEDEEGSLALEGEKPPIQQLTNVAQTIKGS